MPAQPPPALASRLSATVPRRDHLVAHSSRRLDSLNRTDLAVLGRAYSNPYAVAAVTIAREHETVSNLPAGTSPRRCYGYPGAVRDARLQAKVNVS